MLPAHCRVHAVLAPSSDSHIEMEIWMPEADRWNGKFLAVGNGGWAGSISFAAMAAGMAEGYAVASNDTGHEGGSGSFALGHPEKLVDFAYRAMHEMTVQSKSMVQSHYGQAARLSYYEGCSTGGRQGLMAVQRYPEDFDAVIAGAPANPHIYLHAGDLRRGLYVTSNEANKVTSEELDMVKDAVINACDAIDGVTDGLLTDPRACTFDASSLTCAAGGGNGMCLTPEQVRTIEFSYSDTVRSNGDLIFPGFVMGGEDGWVHTNITDPIGIAVDSFRYVGREDADWDWREFDLDEDLALAMENGGYINAMETDLAEFRDRGGKLLLYHGWNDQLIAPENTVNYYSSVLETMGNDQDDWMRLFMVPAMNHCRGGDGPNQLDWLSALERWREGGQAPAAVDAYRVTGNTVDMTRPVCAYPEVATYTGVGSTNDAANFTCEMP
jgi:feruloyl esterase